MEIKGKIAVVSGASSGLGAALAQILVAKGATVYGLARNAEKLHLLQSKLGTSFIPVQLDITSNGKITSWVDKTFTNSDFPSILINNAGVGHFSKLEELSLVKWHEIIDTNLNGTFYLTLALLPLIKKTQKAGHIINIGSIMGKTTNSLSAAYSASKFAIQGFSESLFKELRSFSIKVTCVNPGSIETNFFDDSGIQPHHNMLQADEVAALIVQILETPDNLLIDEITLRPLNPNTP